LPPSPAFHPARTALAWAALGLLLGGCVFESRYQRPKILFLGNSITFIGEQPWVGWNHAHGMAASEESKDYVHQTVRILREKGLDLEPVLGSRDCEICDGVIGEHIERLADVGVIRPRYVVVQLGENADAVEIRSGRLTEQYGTLLQGLKEQGARRIYCISNWDEDSLADAHNEAILRAIRRHRDVKVVDITALAKDRANYGDSVLFPNTDVRWHPGDRGMEGIAQALASAILENP
jgi:hypothetical protein